MGEASGQRAALSALRESYDVQTSCLECWCYTNLWISRV